jgi:hypothetical protein
LTSTTVRQSTELCKAASVGGLVRRQHGHHDTSDHHHRRADSFRWRLVRPGTLVLGRSKFVKEVAEIIGNRRGHGKDAHVLRAEEAGRVGRDRVVGWCVAIKPLTVQFAPHVDHGNGLGASNPTSCSMTLLKNRVRRRGIVRHHNVRPKYTIEIDPPFREPRQCPPIAPALRPQNIRVTRCRTVQVTPTLPHQSRP